MTPPPAALVYVSAALQKDGLDDGKSVSMTSNDFVVPDGYSLQSHPVTASVLWINYPKFTVQVGDELYDLIQTKAAATRTSSRCRSARPAAASRPMTCTPSRSTSRGSASATTPSS